MAVSDRIGSVVSAISGYPLPLGSTPLTSQIAGGITSGIRKLPVSCLFCHNLVFLKQVPFSFLHFRSSSHLLLLDR